MGWTRMMGLTWANRSNSSNTKIIVLWANPHSLTTDTAELSKFINLTKNHVKLNFYSPKHGYHELGIIIKWCLQNSSQNQEIMHCLVKKKKPNGDRKQDMHGTIFENNNWCSTHNCLAISCMIKNQIKRLQT